MQRMRAYVYTVAETTNSTVAESRTSATASFPTTGYTHCNKCRKRGCIHSTKLSRYKRFAATGTLTSRSHAFSREEKAWYSAIH